MRPFPQMRGGLAVLAAVLILQVGKMPDSWNAYAKKFRLAAVFGTTWWSHAVLPQE
jgi:hypothetical protein